jgi:hypothetical protein
VLIIDRRSSTARDRHESGQAESNEAETCVQCISPEAVEALDAISKR